MASGGMVISMFVPQRCKKVIYGKYYVPKVTLAYGTGHKGRREKGKVKASDIKFVWV